MRLVLLALAALGAGFWSSADGTFTAVDSAWRANDTDATTLTIAPGQTVTFGYPEGTRIHNLHFTETQPSCPGLTLDPRPKGWQVDCKFEHAGTYPFACDVHPQMTGTVYVKVPATPTPTADPEATPTPQGGPTPTPDPANPPAATQQAQEKLTVKLAAKQRGTRVKGTVNVAQTASRLEVTVTSGRTRVGRWVRKSTAAGAVAFSVPLDAKARKTLRSKRRLAVTVTIALTPPGASKLTHSAKATIRPG